MNPSDNIPKGGDGLVNAKDIDLSNYVPKEDFTKVSDQAKASTDAIKKLELELDKAKLSLLDPDYMSFKEGKSRGKAPASSPDGLNLDSLTNSQLAEYILGKAIGEVTPLKSTMSDVLAVLELQDVEKRHTDFNDYRDQVKSIIESSQAPLSFEQAYLIAKGNRPADTPPKNIPAGTDKPGAGTVPAGDQHKDFTDKVEAGEDAWNKAVGPGKDRL